MPSNYTPNYNLNQWARTDQVLMADFNADNAKLDAAIQAVDTKADALAGSKADVSALETLAQRVTDQEAVQAGQASAIAKLGNCQVYATTYTGDGAYSHSLTFPHRPMVVLIHGDYYSYSAIYGSAVGHGKTGGEGKSSQVTWSAKGMQIKGSDLDFICNRGGQSYRVVALLDAAN